MSNLNGVLEGGVAAGAADTAGSTEASHHTGSAGTIVKTTQPSE